MHIQHFIIDYMLADEVILKLSDKAKSLEIWFFYLLKQDKGLGS